MRHLEQREKKNHVGTTNRVYLENHVNGCENSVLCACVYCYCLHAVETTCVFV